MSDSNSDSETESIVTLQQLTDEDVMNFGGTDVFESCTYSKGYVKRQSLYICHSCRPTTSPSSLSSPTGHASDAMGSINQHALCYHCANACHDGHYVESLYTKRNVRCDCGNSKLTSACRLVEKDEKINVGNTYNHNYNGKYCICDRSELEACLASQQCYFCEDWFHHECLEGEKSWEEMYPDANVVLVCPQCRSRYARVLDVYEGRLKYVANPSGGKAEELENGGRGGEIEKICISDHELAPSSNKKALLDPQLTKSSYLLLLNNWLSYVCDCQLCLNIYDTLGIAFITDPEDSWEHYARIGEKRAADVTDPKTIYNKIVDTYGIKDFVDKCAVANAIRKMRETMTQFVVTLQKEGKGMNDNPVTESDVLNFFESLKKQ